MECFKIVGKTVLSVAWLIDIYRNLGVTPNKYEEKRRRQAKTDPNVQWDRFDELSYSIRLLLPRIVAWLGFIGIVLY